MGRSLVSYGAAAGALAHRANPTAYSGRMSTETSIGPEGGRGGNEDHGNADGCGNKTLGEHASGQPPATEQAPARQQEAEPGKTPGES